MAFFVMAGENHYLDFFEQNGVNTQYLFDVAESLYEGIDEENAQTFSFQESTTEDVICPKCKKKYRFTSHCFIDSVKHPDWKKAAADGKLFTAICPKCSCGVMVRNPTLYLDRKKKFAAVLMREDDIPANFSIEMIENNLPDLTDYQLRLVTTCHMLVEKIAIVEAGLPDDVIEQVKILMQRQHSQLQNKELYFANNEDGKIRFTAMPDGWECGIPAEVFQKINEQWRSNVKEPARGVFLMQKEITSSKRADPDDKKSKPDSKTRVTDLPHYWLREEMVTKLVRVKKIEPDYLHLFEWGRLNEADWEKLTARHSELKKIQKVCNWRAPEGNAALGVATQGFAEKNLPSALLDEADGVADMISDFFASTDDSECFTVGKAGRFPDSRYSGFLTGDSNLPLLFMFRKSKHPLSTLCAMVKLAISNSGILKDHSPIPFAVVKGYDEHSILGLFYKQSFFANWIALEKQYPELNGVSLFCYKKSNDYIDFVLDKKDVILNWITTGNSLTFCLKERFSSEVHETLQKVFPEIFQTPKSPVTPPSPDAGVAAKTPCKTETVAPSAVPVAIPTAVPGKTLSQLLIQLNLDPARCKLVRHSGSDREVLECLKNPVWFEAYQSCQGRAVFDNCDYILIFLGEQGTSARFLGCCQVGEKQPLKPELMPEGFPNPEDFQNPKGIFYNLTWTNLLQEYWNRLVIDWGKATVVWCQSATNDKKIISVAEPPPSAIRLSLDGGATPMESPVQELSPAVQLFENAKALWISGTEDAIVQASEQITEAFYQGCPDEIFDASAQVLGAEFQYLLARLFLNWDYRRLNLKRALFYAEMAADNGRKNARELSNELKRQMGKL